MEILKTIKITSSEEAQILINVIRSHLAYLNRIERDKNIKNDATKKVLKNLESIIDQIMR